MASKIGDMAVYISANTYGLARDLKHASGMVASFAGNISKSMAAAARPLTSLARDMAAVGGGNLLASGIQQAAGEMKSLVGESLKLAGAAEVSAAKFATMLGSADKASSLIEDLKTFAANSPVGLADAQQMAGSLLGVGVEQSQVTPTIAALSDLSGGDKQSLDSLVRAYGQVRGLGKLTGAEWMQIANTNTLTIGDMAKSMGVTNDKFVQMREQGRVTYQDLQKAIIDATSAGGRFYQQGQKYSETYLGRVDKLSDSFDELKRYFGQALIDELSLKDGADEVATFADSLKPFVDLLRPAIRFVGDLGRAFAQMASEGGKAFLDIADIVGQKLNRAFPETFKYIKDIVGGLKDFKLDPQGIAGFASSIADSMIDALRFVKPYWDSFVDDFVMPIRDAIGFIREIINEGRKLWMQAKDLFDGGGRMENAGKIDAFNQRIDKMTKDLGLSRDNAIKLDQKMLVESLALSAQKTNEQLIADMSVRMDAASMRGNKGVFDEAADLRFKAIESRPRLAAELKKAQEEVASLKGMVDMYSDLAMGKRIAERNARVEMDKWQAWYEGELDKFNPFVNQFKIDRLDLEPRLAELAGKLNEKFIDPIVKFEKDLNDLSKIKDAGRITEDTFALAVADLTRELAGSFSAPQLAQAMELGSQELAAMVNAASVGSGPQTVEGLLDMLNKTQQQALEVARQIASGVNNKPPVMMPTE
jgi:tape measure domain-containing protein